MGPVLEIVDPGGFTELRAFRKGETGALTEDVHPPVVIKGRQNRVGTPAQARAQPV